MSTTSVMQIGSKRNSTFVPAAPGGTYANGKAMFSRGKRLDACTTDEERAGWLDAESAGCAAYMRCMEAEGVPAAVALAGLDALTSPLWAKAPGIEDDYQWIQRGC